MGRDYRAPVTVAGTVEQARQEAFELMLQHAGEAGANAVVAMRYDANEVSPGVTEVLAYGTAVVLEVKAPAA